jgi:hypothetical protein
MRRILGLIALLCLSAPAVGGEGGDLTRQSLYGGTLESGLEKLAPLAPTDPEARFGTGVIRFVLAIEHLEQALYRYGFASPDAGPLAGAPLASPIPVNPAPEPLDYEKVRAFMGGFVADLDAARADLLAAADAGDFKLPLQPLQIRLDFDHDGNRTDAESLAGILMRGFGMPPETPTDAVIGFDRADAVWLAGYTQVMASWVDFLLAHDFRQLVDTTFHRIFPRAGLPMQDYIASTGSLMLDPQSDNAIADALALIHNLNWQVIKPERLAHVRERLKEVVALSRRDWELILAETDDDHELVPSPRQTPMIPATVTEETVAAWHDTLDAADAILDGKLLVPHWRFQKGIDLKAYFETAKRTDFVMLITGYDALPYLKDGPVASPDSFAAANRIFGDQLWGYAFWFN